MTRRNLTVLTLLILVVGLAAWVATRPPGTGATPTPSPAGAAQPPTASPAASPTAASGATPSPSPTAAAGTPGPPVTAGAVTIRATPATPGADFRYLTTRESTGRTHWVVLLDLAAKRAHYVAEVAIEVPAGSQAAPQIAVSPSGDGRLVLIAATEAGGATHLFILDVPAGQARKLLTREAFISAVLSPDSRLLAFHERGGDPARSGLWVGTVGDGSTRRLIADAPQDAAGVEAPGSFSPEGEQLAALTGEDLGDYQLWIVDVDGPETRTQNDEVVGAIGLAGVTTVDWRGAPGDVWAWAAGRSGGRTGVYSFDLEKTDSRGYAQRTVVYEDHDTPPDHFVLQAVDRHPDLRQFVTWEHNGFGGPGEIWIRSRDGGGRKVADTDEAGPRSPWWSPDGSRLYGLKLGDDSVGTVVDLLTGDEVMTYCLRGVGPDCP